MWMTQEERRLGLWMMAYWSLQAFWVLPCSAVKKRQEASSSSVHTSLIFKPACRKPHMANKRQTYWRRLHYWRSIVSSVLMWQGFCGREVVGEEVFGEQLAGSADSSQQTGHRRASVIVRLRENMNVCQKDCKDCWSFPVALQMVFPSSPPPTPTIILIAFLLAGLQLSCLFYDWTAAHSSACPSLTLASLLKRTHTVWVWETSPLKHGTLYIMKPKTPLSLQACLFFLSPAHCSMSWSVCHLHSWGPIPTHVPLLIKNQRSWALFRSGILIKSGQ